MTPDLRPRPSLALRLARLIGATVVLSASLLVFAAGWANAMVVEVEHATYGVAPADASGVADPTSPVSYGGGPVVHSSASYLLFWAPQIARSAEYPQGGYAGEWQRIVSGYFAGVAAEAGSTTNVLAVATQYREGPSGPAAANESSFRGSYTDTDPYPTTENCARGTICLTAAQIRAELVKYIAANSLPTGANPATGATPIYYVLTPPGVDACAGEAGADTYCSEPKSETELSADQICSYHSFIPAEAGRQTILYAVLPWSAGNYGADGATPRISGSDCQDGTGVLQEPNQIGLGPEGEYDAGLADVIVNQAADEQVATITDPLFDGWHDTTAQAGDTDEVPDKCRGDFLGGLLVELPGASVQEHTEAGTAFNQLIDFDEYYLNDEFDEAAVFEHYPGVPCINRVNLVPRFTAQANVANQQVLTFNASESDVDLGVEAYSWDFGDGESETLVCGGRTPTNGYSPEACDTSSGVGDPNPVASTTHTYAYGGVYEVTLTITDDGGNSASVTEPVTVAGPARPSSPSPGSSATSSPGGAVSGSTSGSAGSQTGAGAKKSLPGPVASAAAQPGPLAQVTHKGLVVHYKVNEQVAGHFEVLLPAGTALGLGISGPTATGLAKGAPKQLVIAKGLLDTTRGGDGSVRIKFSQTVARRLKHAESVKLTLRLMVRNAAKSPAFTTVMSSVTLHR